MTRFQLSRVPGVGLAGILWCAALHGWSAPTPEGPATNGLLAADVQADLPAVTVEAPPLRLPEAVPETFSGTGLAAGVPGVTMRSQGFLAPQADLQIRGSAFNSGGFLLSGLALHNPQTEHFQADLPLPSLLFVEPELLTGLDRFRASSGHPSGSLALEFARVEPRGYAELGGGAYGHQFLRLFDTEAHAVDAGVLGGTLFGAFDTVDRTDGYPDNDLERWQGGGHAQYGAEPLQLDLLAAFSHRSFGARGFYGASPDYPAAEEVDDGLLFGTLSGEPGPDTDGRATLGWRYTDDTYWLDRTQHGLYVNETRAHTISGHSDLHRDGPAGWALDLRADADLEQIDGTHGGSIAGAGLGQHTRRHLSTAALPARTVGAWTLRAGGSCDLFSDDGPAWLPAAGVDWRLNDEHLLFASYTEAVRQPSFTELNYESPGSLGNSGLERQHTRTVETGWRLDAAPLLAHASVFVEDGRELVDWVRADADATRWTAVNLDEVQTYGVAGDLAHAVSRRMDLTLSYLGLDKQSDASMYASRYVLDYARHDARAGLRWRLSRRLRLQAWQGVARQVANPVRAGSDSYLTAGAEATWQVIREQFALTLGVINPWDDDFQVYAGQPPAGRRAYAAARVNW